MRRYIVIFTFLLFLAICFGCVNLWSNGKDLGGGIYLVEHNIKLHGIDYYYSESSSTGLIVIPLNVKEYNYNDKWIIAKNQEDNKTYYWIIDKEHDFRKLSLTILDEQLKKHIIGPLDSLQFMEEMKKHNINMKLKDVNEK